MPGMGTEAPARTTTTSSSGHIDPPGEEQAGAGWLDRWAPLALPALVVSALLVVATTAIDVIWADASQALAVGGRLVDLVSDETKRRALLVVGVIGIPLMAGAQMVTVLRVTAREKDRTISRWAIVRQVVRRWALLVWWPLVALVVLAASASAPVWFGLPRFWSLVTVVAVAYLLAPWSIAVVGAMVDGTELGDSVGHVRRIRRVAVHQWERWRDRSRAVVLGVGAAGTVVQFLAAWGLDDRTGGPSVVALTAIGLGTAATTATAVAAHLTTAYLRSPFSGDDGVALVRRYVVWPSHAVAPPPARPTRRPVLAFTATTVLASLTPAVAATWNPTAAPSARITPIDPPAHSVVPLADGSIAVFAAVRRTPGEAAGAAVTVCRDGRCEAATAPPQGSAPSDPIDGPAEEAPVTWRRPLSATADPSGDLLVVGIRPGPTVDAADEVVLARCAPTTCNDEAVVRDAHHLGAVRGETSAVADAVPGAYRLLLERGRDDTGYTTDESSLELHRCSDTTCRDRDVVHLALPPEPARLRHELATAPDGTTYVATTTEPPDRWGSTVHVVKVDHDRTEPEVVYDGFLTDRLDARPAPSLTVHPDGPFFVVHQSSLGLDLTMATCTDLGCDSPAIWNIDLFVTRPAIVRIGPSGRALIAREDSLGRIVLASCHDLSCTKSSERLLTPPTDGSGGWNFELDVDERPVLLYRTKESSTLDLLHCDEPRCGL